MNCMFLSKLSQPGSMRSNVPRAPRTPPTFDILQPPPAGPHPILIPGRATPTNTFSQSDHAYAHIQHTPATRTLVATMTDRRDILEYSHGHPDGFKMLKYGNYLGVILATVRKREVNTNVPTIHPSPLVTRKIITPIHMRYPLLVHLPLERWIMDDLWNYTRDMHCSKVVSKALATEKIGGLRTWGLSIDSH